MMVVPVAYVRLTGCVMLAGIFAHDLSGWWRYGMGSDLYAYTLIVPVITAWLMALRRTIMWAGGLWIAFVWWHGPSGVLPSIDYARLYVLVTLIALSLCAWRGWAWVGARPLPVLLLYLAVPLPPVFEHALNQLLQYGSAFLADFMFRISGMPAHRSDLTIYLPGLQLIVAEQCSGIRSTLILCIAALVGGHVLLCRPLYRLVIPVLVVPLGMVRNAVRIVTLGWLTVAVDPGIISGPLHQRGGPVFFAFSFGLLSCLFVVLRQLERRQRDETVIHTT